MEEKGKQNIDRKKTWKNSILFRTAMFSWLLIVLSLGIFMVSTISYQRRMLRQDLESKAEVVTASLAQVIASAIAMEDYSAVIDHCTGVVTERKDIAYIVTTRKDGFSLVHTPQRWTQEHLNGLWQPSSDKHNVSKFLQSELVNKEALHHSQPFAYSGINWGWIHVGLSTEGYHGHLAAIYKHAILVAAICILGGLGIAFVFARRLTQPIFMLSETTQLLGEGNLSVRADVTSGDEIQTLAESFNHMATTLQEALGQLLTAKEYTENIIKSTGDILIVTDTDMNIQTVNKAACNILGYEDKELVGQSINLIFKFDDLGPEGMEGFAKEGYVANQEIIYHKKDGSSLLTLFTGTAMKDDAGDIEGAVMIARDITQRKKVEETLIKLKTAFMQSIDGITVADLSSNIEFINDAWATMHGYKVEELIGRNLNTFYAEDEVESDMIPFFNRVKEQGRCEGQMKHLKQTGEFFPILMSSTLLYDDKGAKIGIVNVARDITEIKTAEKEQQRLIRDLEEINKIMVGRELRMIELKKEVNKLNEIVGNSAKYNVVIEDQSGES